MRSDIKFKEVEGVAIAVIPDFGDQAVPIYESYLVNQKDEPIKNVFIRASGEGVADNEGIKTATMRKLVEEIPPKSYVQIDMFERAAADLFNEYWISFWYDDYLYEKRYLFAPGMIDEDNFIFVPILEKVGVMQE